VITDHEIRHEIIGAAIEVHKRLVPGLVESADEAYLAEELRLRNLRVDRQVGLPVVYKETILDCGYRIDLVVESRIVVELKAVDALAPIYEAIVVTCLRLSGHKIGLLSNFNVPSWKDGVRRFIV
jgi:GxxExxY protein